MTIPLWSEINPSVKEVLLPLGTIEWNDLGADDCKLMWKHIQPLLFNPIFDSADWPNTFGNISCNYEFYGGNSYVNDHLAETISQTIRTLNSKYKKQSFARRFLEDASYDAACEDFYHIFITGSQNVVFEMLTIFARLTVEREVDRIWSKQDESNEDFLERRDQEQWRRFDKFSNDLNEVFQQFGINYQLTRNGMIPADEPRVILEIYEPVLKKLSAEKWGPVNRDLRDAFEALNNDSNGSGSLTHALAALQAVLQILVHGKIGKGDTGSLITKCIKEGKIPDDDFSKNIIADLNSFWAKERKDKGDPHPKNQYATKKQAKLAISLVMVFMDYIL